MITLITGAPGTGKSAAMMALITSEYKDRPLYIDGVPDLQVEHFDLEVDKWHDTVPDGSLIVIDEVQRHWRPRGPGQAVPPEIAKLETHRHRGLDFIIITQAPRLVHTNVRALVGRHVHLRDAGLLGRWWYEWTECNEGLSFKNAPIKKKYKLPKRVFSLYKSASVHIKPVRSIPPALIVLVLALVAFGYLSWRMYSNIRAKSHPEPAPGAASAAVPGAVPGGARPAVVAGYSRASFRPRDPNEPLSAPAYDHLRQVVSMPRVVGGWCQPGRPCECRFQDGNIAPIPDAECRDRVMRPRFDPYTTPDVGQASAAASGVAAGPAPAAPAALEGG